MIHIWSIFWAIWPPQKRELSLRTGSAQNKVSHISTIATESTHENHANVMSILLDACPCLLPQAYYTDRGACLFLGDAMTTFSFLEIHDTLALAKKGRPPTNGYLIIFNHISSSSEMGPLIDTFLFSTKPKPHNVMKCLLPTFDCWSCLWSWNKLTNKKWQNAILYVAEEEWNKCNIKVYISRDCYNLPFDTTFFIWELQWTDCNPQFFILKITFALWQDFR